MKPALLLTILLALAVPAAAQTTSGPAGVWLKGDLHVHDDHSSDGSLPRQRAKDRAKGNVSVADQIGQGTKMGLAFMPLTDHRTFDQYYDPQWEAPHLLLIPGEEANGSPHAIVLGAADSIVQGAARPDRPGFVHVQQSVWDAHSQGALWSVAHPDDGETDKDTGAPNVMANVQGMDLVEMWNHASNVDKEIAYSENRWNAGFRFGVAGASDNHFREYWDRQGPGLPTTSVLAMTRTERGVVDGLRAGHITLSIDPAGPELLLSSDLKVHGRPAQGGDEVIAPAGTKGHLRLRVRHAAGMQVLVYRQPGRSAGPFKTFSPKGDDETFNLDITAGPAPDWYRAEIRGLSVATPTAPAAMELKAAASPLFLSPSSVEARPEISIPADQGHDDGAVRAAGAPDAFDGFPDIATEAGVSHVVMEAHGEGTSSILYRRHDARGGWAGQGLTISGKAPARFPRVAAHGRDVWVTWQEDAVQIPHRPVIRLRHSADGGKTWRAAATVRSLAGRAEHPVIAVSTAGHPVLAWEEIQAGQPFDVLVQEIGRDPEPRNLSRPGKVFHAADPDDTRTARYPASVWPAIAASPDGKIAVAWQDDRDDIDPLWTGSATVTGTNPDVWRIEVAVRDPSEGWREPAKLGDPVAANRHPDLAFDSDGDLVVAWETKGLSPAGKNLSIVTTTSTDGGKNFWDYDTPSPDLLTMSERPRLGRDAQGAVRIVWYDSRSADWRWRVMTSLWDPTRGWLATKTLDGRGNNTWPATSGGAIVFASTRAATRLQRDPTQGVYWLATLAAAK
jgi:hypothetical protein